MEQYEHWRRTIEIEVSYREIYGKKSVWKVGDKIFIDKNGHAINHCGYELLKKVLYNIDFLQETEKSDKHKMLTIKSTKINFDLLFVNLLVIIHLCC